MLGQPEVFIQFSKERFADDGRVIDDDTHEFLSSWLDAFHGFVDLHRR